MKFLFSVLFICLTFGLTFAQDKKEDRLLLKGTDTGLSTSISGSTLTLSSPKTAERIVTLKYGDLPDKLIISNPDDKDGVTEIEFTRLDLWRLLQFQFYMMPHINRAWEQPKVEENKEKK